MSTSPRWNRWFRFAFATLIAGGSLYAIVWKLGGARSAIPGSFELHTLALAEEVIHEFEIPNPFPEPLMISGVRSQHQDAKVVAFDSLIPARSTGVIRVNVCPMTPGRFVVKLLVDYAGKHHGARMLGLHGHVALPKLQTDESEVPANLKIAPSQLLAELTLASEQKPVVVDLRPAHDFQRTHIPEAIHMPAEQLKVTGRWKSRNIVIVDDGVISPETVETVRALSALGFRSVKILDGGIPAWRAIGARLQGSHRGILTEVSPRTYLRAINNSDWAAVDLRNIRNPLPLPPQVITTKKGDISGKDFAREIRNRLDKSSKVLLITDDGQIPEGFSSSEDDWQGIPVYFVRDGSQGILREIIQVTQKSIPAATSKINATASNHRVSRSVGGCLSCP